MVDWNQTETAYKKKIINCEIAQNFKMTPQNAMQKIKQNQNVGIQQVSG